MNTHAQTPALIIDGTIIEVTPDPIHQYTLTTAKVAEGYGISPTTLRRHKNQHADELIEGKHFVAKANKTTGVQNMNARQRGLKNGNDTIIHWTKRGIVRLGFFIRSERAKRFRDMAEDLVIEALTGSGNWQTADLPIPPVHQSVARVIAKFEIGTHGTAEDLIQLARCHAEIAPRPEGHRHTARPIHDEPPVPHLNDPFAVFLDLYHLAFSKGAAQIEVTIADLLAANAPLAGDFADRHRVCGKRLAELAERPFTTIGTKTPLIVKAHRTAKRRFYTLTRPDQLRADLTATQ
jgi:hypothetical protein